MSLSSDKDLLLSSRTRGIGARIVRAAAGEGALVAFTGRLSTPASS
jgi:NAD(P)-dependent dehydrogenase (short-subunit alcohol dehydrogenase family)